MYTLMGYLVDVQRLIFGLTVSIASDIQANWLV